jgi:primosomal protein N'
MEDAKAEKAIEKGIVEEVEEEEDDEEDTDEIEDLDLDAEIEDVSASEEQVTKMHTLKDRLGMDNSDLIEITKDRAGVGDPTKLTKDEADEINDRLHEKLAKKEKNAEEVHSFPSGEQGMNAAQKLEQKDKEQIVRDVTGEISKAATDKWFYQFEQGGETVTGITYDGVMALFREQGNIDVIVERIWKEQEGEQEFVHVKVRAVDKARNNSIERVSREPVTRRFAMRIAQSTAQKKAVRALVPDEAITEMYSQWKERTEGD